MECAATLFCASQIPRGRELYSVTLVWRRCVDRTGTRGPVRSCTVHARDARSSSEVRSGRIEDRPPVHNAGLKRCPREEAGSRPRATLGGPRPGGNGKYRFLRYTCVLYGGLVCDMRPYSCITFQTTGPSPSAACVRALGMPGFTDAGVSSALPERQRYRGNRGPQVACNPSVHMSCGLCASGLL